MLKRGAADCLWPTLLIASGPTLPRLTHATPRTLTRTQLCRHWQHSEMWWPRLLRCHGEIAWDDYEKDYSDLPEEVLARHRCGKVELMSWYRQEQGGRWMVGVAGGRESRPTPCTHPTVQD